MVIKRINSAKKAEAPAAPAQPSEEAKRLAEIRDSLAK
ncbi:MAG: large-conductance mechanosensitive channel [Arenicella sp.]|jgi:large-conductance mechanosensitive channel